MQTTRHRQRGAVILTVSMMLLFLLGFMGIALDLGRMFIVKTELQTAMDSCALSAAQELDGLADSITRGRSAGLTAGNLNGVNLQSGNWDGQGQLTAASIVFRDNSFLETSNPAIAKYADCQHTQPGIKMWLLHAMAAFDGDTAAHPSARSVLARAVATRSSAQSTCPLPVGLVPRPPGSPGYQAGTGNYGYGVGEWVTMLTAQSLEAGGNIGWVSLTDDPGARPIRDQINGYCGTEVGSNVQSGDVSGVDAAWNYRFGLYGGNDGPTVANPPQQPDYTGYIYTAKNWPNQRDAYGGTPGVAANPNDTLTSENFIAKRQQFANCAGGNTSTGRQGVDACASISGMDLPSYNKVAAGGATTGGHRDHGRSRRLVIVPVLNGPLSNQATVADFACMLMLQPISRGAQPGSSVQLEFRGNAGAPGSPCTTSGLPGGSAGPLVPVLVR